MRENGGVAIVDATHITQEKRAIANQSEAHLVLAGGGPLEQDMKKI